ncbi:hypothetical protein [uncultured Dokdonia sp.]|uniref:hypothetical protein n=1 Tax=uncultured Dokdonia sp. TaxID=575653 RepID=UPI0026311D10|nr:hypothetical protein [uncultured Dokdonia sp.]
MKFELLFIEQIYIEQMTLNFDTAWNESLKKNKKRLIWGIPMIVLGGLIIYGKNNLGFLFIVIGIHYLINFYDYYSFYKKNKNTFFGLVEAEKNEQIEANENYFWEFNDDYLKYKDYKYEVKIKWKAFKSARVIDKNLFIDLNNGNNSSYIIGETEIGTENFHKLIVFVTNKIGQETSA